MAAAIASPPGGFVRPVKRSVTIAGHQSSISLEPAFWSALVAEIDALRIREVDPANLASAVRTWLLADLQGEA